MRVLIDADAFPNIKEIINICKKYQTKIIIYIDTNHEIEDDYATIKFISPGANSVDLAIENETRKNDLVLTQDYGVATITLSKGAKCLNQYGKFYTNENIDFLLEFKNINRILRKSNNIKGPKKRTTADKENLLYKIEEILKER